MSRTDVIQPETPAQLAEALATAAAGRQTVCLGGAFTKNRMGGPVEPADVTITTRGLTRVLQYEPRDLTISVEAGLPYAEFTRLLGANGQMVPLDPPFLEEATVGGVVAANTSGPRRRQFGTARDLIIGMQYATLQGKLIQSGGMVVKNVAGLDTGKLMIGSFGTLAAIATVNFKLLPIPREQSHFVLSFDSLAEAERAREAVLKGVLQPASLDLLNPAAARRVGLEGFVLSMQTGGNAAMIGRYQRELSPLGRLTIAGPQIEAAIREMTPEFLAQFEDGAVLRVSSTLAEVPQVVQSFPVPVLSRAGSGVTYAYFAHAEEASAGPWRAILEFSPASRKEKLDLWPSPGPDFEIMKRVKRLLDPDYLLNRGRLYRQL